MEEEYKKEILFLQKEIQNAIDCLEKKIPKSYLEGISILHRAIDDSQENLWFLRMSEPVKQKEKNKKEIAKQEKQITIVEEEVLNDLFLNVND